MTSSAVLTIPEMVHSAVERHGGEPPTWTPRELQTIASVRSQLMDVPAASGPDVLFQDLSQCIPLAGGIVETLSATRPSEPTVALYRIPEPFLASILGVAN